MSPRNLELQSRITEKLIDYHLGKLSKAEEQNIADHLCQCRRCQEHFDDVVDFMDESKNEQFAIDHPELMKRADAILDEVAKKYLK